MKAHALLIAAGLLAACQRDLPTASAPTDSTVRLTAEEAAIARHAVADVLDRIIPGLSSAAAASALAASLTTLQASLNGGPLDRVALVAAVGQVMQYERATDADDVELEVIRLALATVRN
jgi:hypothetical protein